MKCVINNQVVLSRAPQGPLAVYLDSFARLLSAQGYALQSIHRQILLAACFSHWLKQEGVQLRRITSEHPARYLRYRARRVRPCSGDAAALRHLIDFLRHEGVVAAEKISAPRPSAAERCAQAYEHHLRESRALATATVVNYVPFIRSFLQDRFGNERVTLSRLCASDVVDLYNAKRHTCTGSERSS
ncbi:MAG: hypothetical protein ACE5LB_12940 [Acidiferrobacterales bacterium]